MLPAGLVQTQMLGSTAVGQVEGRCGHEKLISAGRGDSLDLVDNAAGGSVGDTAEQGHAPIDSNAGDLDHAPPFRFGVQRSFAGGTADKEAAHTGVDQAIDLVVKGRFIDRFVVVQGSDHGDHDAFQAVCVGQAGAPRNTAGTTRCRLVTKQPLR